MVHGSWYWLLAPDGCPAMVDTKAEGEAVEGGSSSPATEKREECKRRRDPVAQGSWHWLLAPDGSPATVHRSTASRAAIVGKRKRGAAPEGERHALGPKPRSYRRRRDIIGAEPIETDDEHCSCDTVNEDDFNCITKQQHAQWEENFQLFQEYNNKHKTTRVPFRHPALGPWVTKQRQHYRSGNLTKYR